MEKESGKKLSGNRDFHDWLMENSKNEMPVRLEGFFNNLNKNNMKRRLYDIYTW
jgi:hypothetical protein